MKIVEDLKKVIIEAGKKTGFDIKESDIKIEHPADVNFGDYSTNIDMGLGKLVKSNPRELADNILGLAVGVAIDVCV